MMKRLPQGIFGERTYTLGEHEIIGDQTVENRKEYTKIT